ncbi:MAG: hypothetical protein J6F30_15095 [Cellulosilyticum sp.]|nr:hypothetical protein [Cellulosilyticum sp.]
MEELLELVQTDLRECVTIKSTIEEIADSITWSGREMKLVLEVQDTNQDIHKMSCIGKRYWIEQYQWQTSEVAL